MLEIIAKSYDDLIEIKKTKADRVELVQALELGGLTPSYGLTKLALEKLGKPSFVMVRPRANGFVYSDAELELMREDVLMMDKMGVEHIVMGVLTEALLPDIEKMERIIEGTNLMVTFHRAIDESSDILKSLEILKTMPAITHVLTSGGLGKAVDHIEMINKMIANAGRLKIIVGSGVNQSTYDILKSKLIGNYDVHIGTGVLENGKMSQNKINWFVERLK